MNPSILFLLGYIAFMLAAVYAVERFIHWVAPENTPSRHFDGAPWAWNRGVPKDRCDSCGLPLASHEGPMDYGDGRGPVTECDACLGITS